MRRLLTALACAVAVLGVASPALAAPAGTPTFTANGITSPYLQYASHVDRTKQVGLLLWMDGSGGYGIDNPNQPYLIDADGSAGMLQVAKDNNMVLLVPEAPAPGCDGADNCWYNETGTPSATAKSDWLRALVDKVQAEQGVDKSRVAIGGYSSGAQATTRWFAPRHGAAVQTDGVLVAVAYGGAPAVTPNFPQAYKDAVVGVWNTGTADSAYSTASYGARGGEAWYRNNGFRTDATWPQGVGHARGGEFDEIMRSAIAEYVPAAQAAGSTPAPQPEQPTAPAAWETTVDPTRTGGTFTTSVPAGYSGSVYVRLSSGNYLYEPGVVGPDTVSQTFQSQQCGRTMTWKVEAPSGTVRDSGTFTTDSC